MQYKRGCALRTRYIFNTNEDVQCEWGTSSVQMRMCSTSESSHQVLDKGGTTQRYFFNVTLPSLIQLNQLNTVSGQWEAA